jgi:hypothetical protein
MHRGADRLHNAGPLVAGDDRQQPEGTSGNVGMADSGADKLHQHLVGARIAQVDLIDRGWVMPGVWGIR